MFLSILVRTHKRPDAVRRCLDSLNNQVKKNFEIILISDYRGDKVEELVKEYPDLSFKIKHIENPVEYVACGLYFNRSKSLVKSDYVIFIDDDDVVLDETYTETLERIATNSRKKSVAVIISKAQFPNGKIVPNKAVWEQYPVECKINTLNFCVKNELFQEVDWIPGPHDDYFFISAVSKKINWPSEVCWHPHITTCSPTYSGEGKGEELPYILKTQRILIIVDFYGWAWDIASKQLEEHLSNASIKIVNPMDFKTEDLERYNVILMYPWAIEKVTRALPESKTIICVAGGEQLNDIEFFKSKCGRFHIYGANNEFLKQKLKKLFPEKKILLLSHGIDLKRFKPKDFVVGWIGNIARPLKRFSLAEKIVAQLGIKLKVAGFWKGIGDPEYIDYGDMPDFYNSIDCLLVTSETEAHPLIVYEAMACGVPVVTTDVGDISETIVDGANGFLLPVNAPAFKFAQVLNLLRNNRAFRIAIGRTARESVLKKWHWDNVVKQYEDLSVVIRERKQ